MSASNDSDSKSQAVALFVDLDGTLIKSDVSFESFLGLVKINPLNIFKALVWGLKGRPYLKSKIAEIVELNPECMPYNDDFFNFLKSEKENGRLLILASASDKKYVNQVSEYTKIFSDVIATDNQSNLSGANKVTAIRNYCKEHRLSKDFAYAGNSSVDIDVWKEASESILVTDDRLFVKKAEKKVSFSHKFIYGNQLTALYKSLRIHQWSKNILLFVPLFMAHKFHEYESLLNAIFAFFAFSFAASSIYLVNDLLDIEADRLHRTKKNRPLASGAMQVRTALLLIPLLLGISAVLSLMLPLSFIFALMTYLFTTLLYSFYLKKIPVLDIIILAMLYVLRLFAGSLACGVQISQWMLSFSLFAFTSLACLKRFSELQLIKSPQKHKISGRGYQESDLEPISQFGTASAYLSVFVLVFYINSKEVLALYKQPDVLWLLCPVILYWITRVWILAYRGKIHDDPVVFALRDRVSYFVGLISALILFVAM